MADSDVDMADDTRHESTDGEHHDQAQTTIDDPDDLDEQYPNRPHNHSTTFPFHEIITHLLNPLKDNKRKPVGAINMARAKQGPHGPRIIPVQEQRRLIVERFIGRWRKEVGHDIYPAFRLMMPDKDRDRPMYGLKEKAIGKILVRMMRIDKNSDDGHNLLNWKLPGGTSAGSMAGDFAGRCLSVLQKRPIRTTFGTLTIGEVNDMLDQLSAAQKEDDQLDVFRQFYTHMNPEELMWLIRIILRYMKVGATERTFFDIWHPEAENLFNVSSSLRRVCWELSDPDLRLEADSKGVKLMQCFQPQLAAFQMHSMDRMVARMYTTEQDCVFWIEEKLDGERMQLHMIDDPNVSGGKRFNFWSRKAKDYTYLYGNGFHDSNAALTRHIKPAFNDNVRNIILDGEMITWDPKEGALIPFGTLKTAALSEQRNPYSDGYRPLFKVFDCLFLNDRPLTNYTLRDRRRALDSAVTSVKDRLELHTYEEGRTAEDIEAQLRKVVEAASEGLVLKNPRAMYRLNDRNDDWMKVKPEYMTEFGEALDCVVIGGYYGTGHRGGRLSSFLCGLRVDKPQIAQGAKEYKCYSFFKVGGGFSAADYADIRHRTDGKWHDWDAKRPPLEFMELGGGDRQYERPDVWIDPRESIVLEVKAAQVTGSDQFRYRRTLRFPRFKRIRTDKSWETALSMSEFEQLQAKAESEKADKKFKVDETRRSKPKKIAKKETVLAGQETGVVGLSAATSTASVKLFEDLDFYVMTECLQPKTTRADVEQMIKMHGGNVVQQDKNDKTIIVADRNLVKVASVKKTGMRNIVRPAWVFDCIRQAEVDVGRPRYLLPYQPEHMYFCREDDVDQIGLTMDEFGDSFAKDTDGAELKRLMKDMVKVENAADVDDVRAYLDDSIDRSLPASIFRGCRVHVDATDTTDDHAVERTRRLLLFCGADLVDLADVTTSHVVVFAGHADVKDLRRSMAKRRPGPRLVTSEWVEACFDARTRLDEERFTA